MSFCASIAGLSVSFHEHEVLKDIHVDFPSKKASVLLGRSGSGKTTLLRELNRLNECFEGYKAAGSVKIFLNDETFSSENSSSFPLVQLRRRVGMVFQTPNPLPLSIRKNMTLPLTLTGNISKKQAEEIMEDALKRVVLWPEVSDRLDKPALSLSGGQQQRLCLARALALKPDILLLDEPTASLDIFAASKIEELIISLKKDYSIIMVSHNIEQANAVGDEFFTLTDGRLEKTI